MSKKYYDNRREKKKRKKRKEQRLANQEAAAKRAEPSLSNKELRAAKKKAQIKSDRINSLITGMSIEISRWPMGVPLEEGSNKRYYTGREVLEIIYSIDGGLGLDSNVLKTIEKTIPSEQFERFLIIFEEKQYHKRIQVLMAYQGDIYNTGSFDRMKNYRGKHRLI